VQQENDIAQRLRRIESRLELQDLVFRYNQAIDERDWDALRFLYAEQARLGRVVGRDNVVSAVRSERETFGRTVHVAHGQLLDFDDDERARGLVVAHAELDIGGHLIVCHIRYHDSYVHEDSAWRFADRSLKFRYALPWDQMADSLTAPRPVRWPGTELAASDEF
jgi:hypothetical protein